MHPILESYVDDLSERYQLNEGESKKFEVFCNYCVLSLIYFGRFNPLDVTTAGDDASIDGAAVVIDGELILTVDDAKSAFETHRKNINVEILFTQVKSGEYFSKKDVSSFALGLQDFLTLKPKLPQGDYNNEVLSIINVVIKNLKKVTNSRPNCYIYYCTSGNYSKERELEASFLVLKDTVEGSELFNDVFVTPFGRKELLGSWKSVNEKNEAKVKVVEYCGIPANRDVPQSYIAVVNGKVFVESLLLDQERNLKHGVFEENVRAFLGDENSVNTNISLTLRSKEKRHLFSVLNNGITIVAPQLTLTANSKEFDLVNYQIINGCQTSNTLYQEIESLDETVNVVVRFIESPDNQISSDIISATNSQTNISQERFHGLKEKARLVQHYFDSQNSKNSETHNQIYFERRENEYRDKNCYATQIFDVRELGRAYAAGILNEPHTASRYVKNLFIMMGDKFFKDDDSEALYYLCALILYKFNTLANGRKENAHLYSKYKWHIITLFMWVAHSKVEVIHPNASKANKYADKVIQKLNSSDRQYTDIFKKCFSIIDMISPAVTNDQIKRSKFTSDLKLKAEEYLRKK
ncbi:AIPR family protein [Shewanella sp. ZOR0012]|uniref:AIPR family protein n=2 Tax=Shewanellaceae TaxID=267890 RepID=UPI000645C441|nr:MULTISPECIES: AIPR family protein [Shewanella]NSM26530.1 AIPR family protein [Shewanella sp. ZOR0012]UML92987.1 AIPR family protein [Shewanella xiamenensis]